MEILYMSDSCDNNSSNKKQIKVGLKVAVLSAVLNWV